jgi:aryl-alcohol dehydrogenase-like predicted oxidoreductase
MSTSAHRLCLGTAQFGLDYGIANRKGKVPENEVLDLLQHAHHAGVDMLDTASAYGTSEELIGRSALSTGKSFNIVSKLPPLKGQAEARGIVEHSLNRLGIKKIYGYLIHSFEDYNDHPDVWRMLTALRSEGVVGKIGFSLYHPQDLDRLLEQGVSFDLVQLPYSVFDRRFEKYLPFLKKSKIEVHARSVFLQGLAFMDHLPAALKGAESALNALRQLSVGERVPVNAIALNFVLLNEHIDRVVIGVDSFGHLKQNLDDLKFLTQVKAFAARLGGVAIEDENILLPYRWKL